jgi:hypothetical protein
MSPWRAAAIALLWTVSAGIAAAAEPGASSDAGPRMVLAPRGDSYPPYLADPHRPSVEILEALVTDVDIAESGNSRYGLKLGGRVGVARLDPHDRPGQGWQFGVEIGFVGEFDLDREYDNIGWDGIYAFLFTAPLSEALRVKLGTAHRSSHVGDEYMERTGRRRINYTRQERLAGLSWYVTPAWRLYGEYGRAYEMNNEVLQQPGRAQLGLEYQPARAWRDGRLGWFAALDVSATQERDWQADSAVRVGYVFDADERRWSLSATYYRGRPTIGEFFQNTESFVGIGLRLEL